MDYSIDLVVLEDSLQKINASKEEITSCQNQLFTISWLLLNTGWSGESANRLIERSEILDERFSAYQTRSEKGSELLLQLQNNGQDANNQASSLAAIWGGGLLGTLGQLLNGVIKAGSGDGDVVSLNRSACGQVHSLCSQLRNLYVQQEQKIRQLRSLYYGCNENFYAIAYIDAAGNEINRAEDQINQFTNKLSEYESAVDHMEHAARSRASNIIPVKPFSSK